MKRILRLRHLVWLALPVLFVWALRGAPFDEIVYALKGLGLRQIAALAGLNLLILLLMNSRWWLLLRAQGYSLPYLPLFAYRLAAFTISYFTPGTQFGGEPLQVWLLHNRQQVHAPAAVVTVTLDKLFELLANFTFLAAGLVLILSGGWLNGHSPAQSLLVITILPGMLLFYLLALWAGRFPLSWLVVRAPDRWSGWSFFRRAAPLVVSTERQISSLFRQKPVTVLSVLLLSGIILGLMLFEYRLMLAFLGLDFTLVQTVTALTAARVAFLAPLPAGLGALEASQMLAMQLLGVSPALGISASLLIRARDLTIGFIGLLELGILSRWRSPKPVSS